MIFKMPLLHPQRTLVVLLLAVGTTLGATGKSGSSLGALDENPTAPSSLLTAPAVLLPASSERFSRLLKESANVLQFSSISNDAPPIWGIHDGKKGASSKSEKPKGKAIGASSFGRRALDYDESHSFDEPSESRNVATPYPTGNEYVYVRTASAEHQDSDVAASVTSINNKPPRVPLALLRQKKGKRVNISPLFTEVSQVQGVGDSAKEFVWVDQPAEQVAVNRQGRQHQEAEGITTNPVFQEEDLVEATTLGLIEDSPIETTTSKQTKSKMIVNIVTSAPRISVESSSSEKKGKSSRRKTTTTTTTVATTSAVTSTEAVSEAASAPTPAPTTTISTTTTTTTTTAAPETTTITIPVLSSHSPKPSADDKDNLVNDSFHRTGASFQGFEDSQTKLQTAESSQPARVNVRPAQNGKEYEYEYIYYYYDDDDDNSTEKHTDPASKPAGPNQSIVKQGSTTSTTLTPSSPAGAASPASSSTPVAVPSSSTTIRPQLTSDADFEYEDDAALEEEEIPEIQKSTPLVTRTTEAPVHKGVSSAEKLSNSNPINQLDRSRGPKILSSEKFDDAAADYKLETEASQEDAEAVQPPVRSRGQPHREPESSEEEEDVDSPQAIVREPATSAPVSTSAGLDTEHMSTLAKTHKDSVNVPIVLKQSSLLKAVPVSQLHPQGASVATEQQPTVPYTTPTTTTTTEASSARPLNPRLRGNRLRGNVTPRPTTITSAAAPEPVVEEKPQQTIRRPNLREPTARRIPPRRPAPETADNAPEQQPAASPIIETHARPLPIRPRFPPRTGGHGTTTVAAPSEGTDAPVAGVTASAVELNSLEDKKVKDVRAKATNDLYAFTRLQQAISSRAPSRIPPKLVAGFVNSAEVTTDAMSSSEVTTVSSFGGQSSESNGAVFDEATSTTTTTTTTTTEAVPLDKFGRPKGRFNGRARRPLAPGASTASSTTTESPSASVTPRGRFTGRRRSSTTETPEGVAQSSASVTSAEAPKPRIPSRNRFSGRTRTSASTEATSSGTDGQQVSDAEKSSTPASTPRRRPGFQGRRRPAQAETSAQQEESSPSSTSGDASSSTAAPATPGRSRFNFAAGGRARPSAAPAAANPVRIRGGGRLRGPTSTTTTTEAVPQETVSDTGVQEQPVDAEESPTIQNEHVEQPLQPASPESTIPQRGGVLGRLKSRPKLVVTTTTATPDIPLAERKPSRLNGILNRRKSLGQLTSAVHVKEEVRETTSEGAEEDGNHAKEQTDEDHKGVVVQVSSSVTESEEVNDAHAAEVAEPSTTPGSILNRLKSQRKPGSIFRKKPDPHGE